MNKKGSEIVTREEKIMERVKLHYVYATQHYGTENVLGVFLYGSQNYNCDNEDADVDTKCILLPDLYHLAIKPYETKHLHIPRDGGLDSEVCECMTIMHMVHNWKKQNPNFLEIMFTPFCFINPDYRFVWKQFIEEHREAIARYDVRQGIMSVAYQAINTIKQNPMDGKKIGNSYRLMSLLRAYDAGYPYDECLKPINAEWIKDLKAGRCAVRQGEAEHLIGYFNNFICQYENANIDKNGVIEVTLENFILKLLDLRME